MARNDWDDVMPMRYEKWLPCEDDYLLANYFSGRSVEQIAVSLGRSYRAVTTRARSLGLRMKRVCNDEQLLQEKAAVAERIRKGKERRERNARIAGVIRNQWQRGAKTIASQFGVSVNVVRGIAWKEGVSWRSGKSSGSTGRSALGSSHRTAPTLGPVSMT